MFFFFILIFGDIFVLVKSPPRKIGFWSGAVAKRDFHISSSHKAFQTLKFIQYNYKNILFESTKMNRWRKLDSAVIWFRGGFIHFSEIKDV